DINNTAQGRATGAFVHRLDVPSTIDAISSADGTSNTVSFAENTKSDNWASPDIRFTSIGIPVGNTFDSSTNQGSTPPTSPSDWYLPSATRGGWTLQFQGPWTLAPNINLKNGRINQMADAGVGQAPRPSSNHPGGSVIVGFLDGSSITLNEQIDDRVWGRLLTSRGTKDYNQLLESRPD
ncbi:MAG TPA: DUF1559 domain-containing protein, partial [Planctomycetaceae bacterium]|nr:DUF1559 domain-containing protein [Planctomycetaceae bacterium]